MPSVLFFVFIEVWILYIQTLYLKSVTWNLLEIKIPKNISRTPKAMEQVFAAVHSIYVHGMRVSDKWWDGKVQPWISFEIVGYAGGVYFFIRTPSQYRNLIEASVYAQYPEAEIREANDYVDLIPATVPNASLDLFGTNFMLAREDAYPIRTYEYFEDKEDERRLDPIAAITEVMSKLKEGETIWLQLLVKPATDAWKKKAEEHIGTIIGTKPKTKPSVLLAIISAFGEAFSTAEPVREKKQDNPNMLMYLTPNQKDVVQAMEEKIAKLGFYTNIRFVYIDRRDRFTKSNVSAIQGALSQFNTQNLNALRPDMDTYTRGKWPFKKEREYRKKRLLFSFYKSRMFSGRVSIFNTEELATIYHFPSLVVEAPMLQRIEAKKGEPPPNLPLG